jgi:hypothetical protein
LPEFTLIPYNAGMADAKKPRGRTPVPEEKKLKSRMVRVESGLCADVEELAEEFGRTLRREMEAALVYWKRLDPKARLAFFAAEARTRKGAAGD